MVDIPIIGIDAEWFALPREPGRPARNAVLSYQYAGRYRGKAWSGIAYTKGAAPVRFPTADPLELAAYPVRYRLADLLSEALRAGLSAKALPDIPDRIILTAHYTRADISHMADYAAIKNQFDGVHKTYATIEKDYTAFCTLSGRRHKVAVHLVDTSLLVPATAKSLAALGKIHGYDKLDPGMCHRPGLPAPVPYIAHMNWLLEDNPTLYEEYSVKDAEITALHVDKMMAFCADELGLQDANPPPTLASIATRYVLDYWHKHDIDHHAVQGERVVKDRVYIPGTHRYVTKKSVEKAKLYTVHEELAKECFHGGRNECFYVGPTPVDTDGKPYREVDITSAYLTTTSLLRVLDFEAARQVTKPEGFTIDELGFGLVEFDFPRSARYPCLPVVAPDDHGLVYPRRGQSYATGPEIYLAIRLGARVTVLSGVSIPWIEGSPYPYRPVNIDLATRRKAYAPDTLPNVMFKQMGNSIFGKIAQGLSGKKGFSPRHNTSEVIGESKITNPFYALHITGLIRALVSEILPSIPPQYLVASVTTDGILTNCPVKEIPQTGHVYRYMKDAAADIGASALLSSKVEAARLLSWSTRGVASIVQPGSPLKLARGGMREPSGCADANAYFVKECLTRRHGKRYTTSQPASFPEQHRRNEDFTFHEVVKTMTFEYDMKRKPAGAEQLYVALPSFENDNVINLYPHLTYDTTPWDTIEEFHSEYDIFSTWRHKHQGKLKRMSDWERWSEYRKGLEASKSGITRSKDGLVGQARRLFLLAYTRKEWGLPGGDYQHVADTLTAAGYPTTVQDLKNCLRIKKPTPEYILPADPDVVGFLDIISLNWKGFERERMLLVAEICVWPRHRPERAPAEGA